MSKLTKASFKSFLKKNEGKLYIQIESRFDGMTDCVQQVKKEWSLLEKDNTACENQLGYKGVWLVGSSRDSFKAYECEQYKGYHVYNCCGSFTIAIKKGGDSK